MGREAPRRLPDREFDGRWATPRAAWADVLDALRGVAADAATRPPVDDARERPVRQVIYALRQRRRLTEDGAAEALGLSLTAPVWTPGDGVRAEDIFDKCELVLDDLADPSEKER